MCKRVWIIGVVTIVAMLTMGRHAAGEVTAERSKNGVVVKIDGKLFTEYWKLSGNKPILWPVIGPTGKPVTRAFPMVESVEEDKDHPHHRSLWFTHGEVNGVNFWGESRSKDKPALNKGMIKHREFVSIESGQTARIVARNDWIGGDGTKHCEDERVLVFGSDGDSRWIDFDITIKAVDRPVTFGDTKEGSMAIRLAPTMRVKKEVGKGGHIINSEGHRDGDAWGKRAAWCDYYGPLNGQTVGVAIFDHPQNPRHPTWWHVRRYGLFAANPFGVHNFEKKPKGTGDLTIKSGESVTFKYRFYFHKGDYKQAKVAELYREYAAIK